MIEFSSDDHMYILGDIIDRGSQSLEMIEFCMENEKNVDLLMGNHEDLMLSFYADEIDHMLWFINGGVETYRQLESQSSNKKLDILNFLETRPLAKIVDNFILVHAGISVPEDRGSLSIREVMQMQSKEYMLWSREEFINCPTGLDEYTVIFGHTPTVNIYSMWDGESPKPFTIWHDQMYGGDKICIDCGAVFREHGGRLGALRLDDMEEFYV